MGDLGVGELLILFLVFNAIPMSTLWRVASARGQPSRYMLWGLLSYAGLVIGLLVLLAMPRRTKQVQRNVPPTAPDIF